MKNIVGKKGEILAEKYLIKNNYKILEVNYSTKIGEIDIIAKKDDVIVFVEVKLRNSTKFGFPREAVTPTKQRHIIRVATSYLQKKSLLESKVRFDVIEILNGQITHIENAFY